MATSVFNGPWDGYEWQAASGEVFLILLSLLDLLLRTHSLSLHIPSRKIGAWGRAWWGKNDICMDGSATRLRYEKCIVGVTS